MVVNSVVLNWMVEWETSGGTGRAVTNPTLACFNRELMSSFLTNFNPPGLVLDLISSTSFLPESFTISRNLEHQDFTSVINLIMILVRQEKRRDYDYFT